MMMRSTWQSWYLRFSSSSLWRWRSLPVGRPPSPSCCASTAPVEDGDGDDDDHDDDDDNGDDGVNDKDEADQSPHGSRQITGSQWRTFPTKLQLLIKSKEPLAMQMQLDVQTPVHKEAMKHNE